MRSILDRPENVPTYLYQEVLDQFRCLDMAALTQPRRHPFWFTEAGLDAYLPEIQYANVEYARYGIDVMLAVYDIERLRPDDVKFQSECTLMTANTKKFKTRPTVSFPDAARIRELAHNPVLWDIQAEIDKLSFMSGKDEMKPVAEKIQEAYDEHIISGIQEGACMNQLWQKNEDVMRWLGYEY